MKTYSKLITLLSLTFCTSTCALAGGKDGHKISFKIKGMKDSTAYLANYFGDKTYIQDTAKFDANGNAVFEGKKKLEEGIYMFVVNRKKLFEFMLTDQVFSMETDTSDYIRNMKIKGSEENILFYNYLNFIDEKSKLAEPLRKSIEKLKADPSKKEELKAEQAKIDAVDKEVKAYKLKFMQDHPNTFVTKVFKASQDPEIPETPILPDGKKDSTFAYRYYRAHYWDYIDFSEGRLIRTPIFHNKLDTYIKKMIPQIPDSINSAADLVVGKAKANPELYKYCIWYITNTYETSNIMGMDAVFVHMVKKYYSYTNTPWVDSTTMFKITDKAKKLEPLLLGKKAPNVICKDSLGIVHNLYSLPNKYVVLYFFDPDCGHCQKATPKLVDAYDRLKAKGVEVFSVGSSLRTEYPKWTKFIRDYKLKWICVADPDYQSNFRYEYDLQSYPQVYILDKEKKIIGKKLGTEQVEDFLDKVIERDKNQKNIK